MDGEVWGGGGGREGAGERRGEGEQEKERREIWEEDKRAGAPQREREKGRKVEEEYPEEGLPQQ